MVDKTGDEPLQEILLKFRERFSKDEPDMSAVFQISTFPLIPSQLPYSKKIATNPLDV